MASSEKFQTLSGPSLKGKRILIVDDTIDNQILEHIYLTSAGANVDLASSGEEGIEKALHENYDAILMDLHMPELDGFRATKRLRKVGFTKPIIAVTANSLPETRATAMTSGFNDFVTKPLNRDTLIERIDRIFAQNEENPIRQTLIEITDHKL